MQVGQFYKCNRTLYSQRQIINQTKSFEAFTKGKVYKCVTFDNEDGFAMKNNAGEWHYLSPEENENSWQKHFSQFHHGSEKGDGVFHFDVDLNIDFQQLSDQKCVLIDAAEHIGGIVSDQLYGIVHLIDEIQDQAAEIFGEEIVFPNLNTNK